MVLELTAKNFEKEVIDSHIPVLVDFWAPWCQPCLMMIPVLEELSKDLKGKLKIAKINIDDLENQKLAMKYQIQSIPNIKVFVDGKVVKEIIGLQSKEKLKGEIINLL